MTCSSRFQDSAEVLESGVDQHRAMVIRSRIDELKSGTRHLSASL